MGVGMAMATAMDPRWRETFLAWAREPAFARRVTDARGAVQRALAACRQPYVAYSGGKDSTALVHLVVQAAPEVLVLHWDYGRAFIPQPVHEEILANAQRLGVRRLRVETSPLYDQLGRRARNVLGRHMIGRLLPQLRAEGYDLAFVGLRAEESLKRRRRIRRGQAVGVIAECWPLADWTWLDVWAYIVSCDLPYLSLYDRVAPLVGWDRARFTTLHDPEFFKYGAEPVDNVLWWRWRHGGP